MDKSVVELFAGVGGFRVGLNGIKAFDTNGKAIENRNWDFVWANQFEPSTKSQYAYDCYKTRFGDDSVSNCDIALVDKQKIPNHTLLVAGFPCQDYSVARPSSKAEGIQGKKGVLFWEIAEILKVKNPPFVLMENVDRLLKSPSKQRGRDFGIMLKVFQENDYSVEWRVINAADYGASQRRRRVFIFAFKNSTKYRNKINDYTPKQIIEEKGIFASAFPSTTEMEFTISDLKQYTDAFEVTQGYTFNFKESGIMLGKSIYTSPIVSRGGGYRNLTLRDIRETNKDLSSYFLNETQVKKMIYLKGSKRIPRVKPNGDPYFYTEGNMNFPDDLDLPSRTMLTSERQINRSSHVIVDSSDEKTLRWITPIEAERLQSFPDDWTNTGMPERKRYFMMGNALVTRIIDLLESSLSNIVENE